MKRDPIRITLLFVGKLGGKFIISILKLSLSHVSPDKQILDLYNRTAARSKLIAFRGSSCVLGKLIVLKNCFKGSSINYVVDLGGGENVARRKPRSYGRTLIMKHDADSIFFHFLHTD